MTYVITRSCCNDASCVPVCPVNCIHPTPEEPGYATAEMLYIDPEVCIECGACVDACPVSAIVPDYELTEDQKPFEQINAAFYQVPGARDYAVTGNSPSQRVWTEPVPDHPLRVAIVGSGPSAFYTADELISVRGLPVLVDLFERLPTPFGLVRYGVAPDHQSTKEVTRTFSSILARRSVRIFLNTEIGRDLSFEQLSTHYDAVVFATGAMSDRALGIPGEHLPGSYAAADFVGWYNGHPDLAHRSFDLTDERVVIVGNGNVALDIARVLTAHIDVLERSDIADHALEALRESKVREVVILGRRGPAQGAFTSPELLGLAATPGVHVRVEAAAEADRLDVTGFTERMKLDFLAEIAAKPAQEGDRTVVLRFSTSPEQITGTERVTGIRVRATPTTVDAVDSGQLSRTELGCGLVLRSIGYRGRAIGTLPFDEERGVIPHEAGRVHVEDGEMPAYVVGWIKRGPSGVIGTNRRDAQETASALLEDVARGRIRPRDTPPDVADLLPNSLSAADWRTLDKYERDTGRASGRPRSKVVTIEQMLRRVRSVD